MNGNLGRDAPTEATIAVMRLAGRLVDEEVTEAMTAMQCRVNGYLLASLLLMNQDPDSERVARELLAIIGLGSDRSHRSTE